MTKRVPSPAVRTDEPESLAELRGDCARMAPRWPAPAGRTGPAAGPAPAAGPSGVRVPERSARLLDGMSDYGD